ncbi:unnamed protein product [Durusdinium trenchii]|uniref:ABC1 atypical kinase-like domain-containing protein n=1 Tax=Durusdinium trenchii TaxID=1381693 RepID=A0ABP0KEJ7_9DINO
MPCLDATRSLSLSRMRQLWIEPNVVTYTAAMACGQWQLPLKICKMNTVTSNAKLNCLVSTSGHWDQAVETLLQMRLARMGVTCVSFNSVMNAQVFWPDALGFVQAMRNLSLRQNSFSACSAINSFAKKQLQQDQWQLALVQLSAFELDLTELDVFGYNAAISACEKGHRWLASHSLLTHLQRCRLPPDDVSSGSFLASLSPDAWLQALTLLRSGFATAAPQIAAITTLAQGRQWQFCLASLPVTSVAQGSAVAVLVGGVSRCDRPVIAQLLDELNGQMVRNLQPIFLPMRLLLELLTDQHSVSRLGLDQKYVQATRWQRPSVPTDLGSLALERALQEELREAAQPNLAKEREARAVEDARRRQEEVKRLRSEASIWRLLQLAFLMLPLAIYWPVWFMDPITFWNWVSARIDSCGPCFIKLAQWAATRRDLFPDAVCAALGRMHESVSAPWSKTIEPAEVCSSLRNAEMDVESLDSRPYASGSMAEVYFGTLKDGTEVAVKCMRPGVKHLLEADLAWLLRLSSWADSLEPLRLLHLGKAAEEFCEQVQMQTDFRTEASHLQQFQCNFKGLTSIRFPSPLYASQEILVLSREMGQELSRVFRDAVAFGQTSDEKTTLAQHSVIVQRLLGIPQEMSSRIATDSLAAYMRMIFHDQFIHGDLHPGNVMLKLQDASSESQADTESTNSWLGRLSSRLRNAARSYSPPFELIILDAGLAIPLPREKVEALRSLALAIIYGDFNRAAEILYQQSPDTSRCQDPQAFKNGLAKAFRDCRKQVYEDGFVQVSDSVLESLRLVRYYNVGLDTTLTWTLLGMLSIEGSARQLDPEVDCARAATRYILNMPSLWNELRSHSWHTSRHMFAEMFLTWLGIDYWEWRNRSSIFANVKW